MNDYPEGEPCWAPGAADHLASILTGDELAIEWGGGQSTPWLAPRVKVVHTIESDPVWRQRIEEWTSEFDNVHIHERAIDDPLYIDVVIEFVDRFRFAMKKPNLWLIDGYRRIDCLAYVEEHASHCDVVVCDDALDYAEHLLSSAKYHIKRFAMPHPHAGLPCVSEKNTRHRNTVRTHAPMTKETWIWRV